MIGFGVADGTAGENGGQVDEAVDAAAFYVAVRQLAVRYALAVDSRDLVGVSRLFSVQSDFSRWGEGSEGCKIFFRNVWEGFGPSVHTVTNHVIHRVDRDWGTGIVYCSAQQQQHDESWRTIQLAYFDQYIREPAGWLFRSRKSHFWYVDVDGERRLGHLDRRPMVPDAWASWQSFWDTVDGKSALSGESF